MAPAAGASSERVTSTAQDERGYRDFIGEGGATSKAPEGRGGLSRFAWFFTVTEHVLAAENFGLDLWRAGLDLSREVVGCQGDCYKRTVLPDWVVVYSSVES